jgi:hypothetical protein
MRSHWLPWKGTGCYGKSLVAKEVYGCYGKSMVLCKSLVAMETKWLLWKSVVAIESQWLLLKCFMLKPSNKVSVLFCSAIEMYGCYGKSMIDMLVNGYYGK